MTKKIDLLHHLLSLHDATEWKMKGSIQTKEKCPVCGEKFYHVKRLGFICKTCKTTPRRFYIYFHYKGKRYRIYSTPQGTPLDSYHIALTTLTLINTEIRNGTFEPAKYLKSELSKFFVSNLIQEYYARKHKEIAPSYLPTFRKHIETAISFFGPKDVREIKKIDLEKYLDFLLSRNIAPKTAKNYLDTFKAFLNYCKSTFEIIPTVPPFPIIDIPKPVTQWVNIETQRIIYENTPDEDKPIILFLLLTGCRPAEARALKVKDINLTDLTITISRSFSRNTLRNKRKGRLSPPVIIPIHPDLLPILNYVIKGKLPDAFVFHNPRTGSPYTQESLLRLWSRIRKKLALPKTLRLYAVTRHSFASILASQGATIQDIAKLLGHTNIHTSTRYAHLDLHRQRVVLNLIRFTQNRPERKSQKR